jgi:hypothetical protein
MGLFAFLCFLFSDDYQSIDDTFRYYRNDAIYDLIKEVAF